MDSYNICNKTWLNNCSERLDPTDCGKQKQQHKNHIIVVKWIVQIEENAEW